jgi:hypothetical protein
MLTYFARLSPQKLILWCYLCWYLAIVSLYFDPSPMLWISSVGLSVVIGIALNLATQQQSAPRDPWIIFRLFLIPFCVSSYSALIKGQGFILVFPPSLRALSIGLMACASMICLHLFCRLIDRRAAGSNATVL